MTRKNARSAHQAQESQTPTALAGVYGDIEIIEYSSFVSPKFGVERPFANP
jgi:hypothetical protein